MPNFFLVLDFSSTFLTWGSGSTVKYIGVLCPFFLLLGLVFKHLKWMSLKSEGYYVIPSVKKFVFECLSVRLSFRPASALHFNSLLGI